MLAEVRQEYVFKTIDPAVAPEGKKQTSRALICVLGTLSEGCGRGHGPDTAVRAIRARGPDLEVFAYAVK
jgi:hypothetical protein